jgi:selenocysteine lyase/cysteine desulfurase
LRKSPHRQAQCSALGDLGVLKNFMTIIRFFLQNLHKNIQMQTLEQYFSKFRQNIVGIDVEYRTAFGTQKLIYADWIASGRLYKPLEDAIVDNFGPYVANTHTEASETGTLMTNAYMLAQRKIKEHVGAGKDDVLITAGSGMTTVINKFQRILGLKICGNISKSKCLKEREKPVVFVSHMEHHSNHTSWFETVADVVVLNPSKSLLVDPDELSKQLEKYKNRELKIGSFTACSNVTGIHTPIHELARIMHEYDGVCLADYAASAPYENINMHPANPMEKLDAVMFSPHKFLGGPGSSGVLVFDSQFYNASIPDNPGGGTVDWTNPWGEYKYIDDIELREDGGTPGFLQAIRTALCIELKNQMGVDKILERENQLLEKAFLGLDKIPTLKILAEQHRSRLGVISFYFEKIHYNLVVKLLSDRYGIQTRGGCACAGTYGHFLLNVDYEHSQQITSKINTGDLSEKPGWVRLSLHPTMTDDELDKIIFALTEIQKNISSWEKDYQYFPKHNEFKHIISRDPLKTVTPWFSI